MSFQTPDALRQEFESNLSNGGIFVATEDAFELREPVTVRIGLEFADEHVLLDGEVVNVVPPELVGAGGKPGVALQLVDSPQMLRERFAEYLEAETGGIPGNLGTRPEARRAPRKRARIEAQLDVGGDSLRGHTRDLSRSGALVGVPADVALGEQVQLTLRHPSTGEEVGLGGRVVRHVESDEHGISAVGIEFDENEASADGIVSFVDDVQRVEHTRRMGGIVGPIEELGPHAVLQMFATTANAGTLYLRSGEEEGVIGFEGGLLRAVRLGPVEGMPALIELMRWTDGSFEFHARLEDLDSREAPLPLEAALLDALRQIDEARSLDPARFSLEAKLYEGMPADGYDPTKIEAAILDLAPVGFLIERVLEVIPDPDADIFRALANLADMGLVRIED